MSHLGLIALLECTLRKCEAVLDRRLFNTLVKKRPDISRNAVVAAREHIIVKRLRLEATWPVSEESIHCRICFDCRAATWDLFLEYNALNPAQPRESPSRH
jgi:hypothetical protein